MVAGVAGEDGVAAAVGVGLGGGGVFEQLAHGGGHLGGGAGEAEVAGAEEVLGVLPGSGEQWDAAGEGLEDADGGDAAHDGGSTAGGGCGR